MSRLGRTLRIIPVLLPIAVLLPFLGVARGAPSVSSLHRAFFNAPSTLQPEQPPTHPDRAKQQEPLNVELIVIGFTPGSTPYRPGDTVMGLFRIWNHEGVDLSKVTLNLYYSADKLSLADCDPMPGQQSSGWATWPNLTVDLGGIGAYDIADVDVNFKVSGPCPPCAEVSVEMVAEAMRGSELASTQQTESFGVDCEPNPQPGDVQVSIQAPAQLALGVQRYYVIEVSNTGTASLYNVHAVVYSDKLYVQEMYPSGGEWADPEFQWVWHEIEAGTSKRAALLFEIPPGAATGAVYHTSVEYGADYLARDFEYKDVAVIAPQPTRTPTPTVQPTIKADLTCQVLQPADGEMAVGEAMVLRLTATNTGSSVIKNLSTVLEWDAACLEYKGSTTPPPDPEVEPDAGQWKWEHWGTPYLQPGASFNMQITLRAKEACGKTTLGASLLNPALPGAGSLDQCSTSVTLVKADKAGPEAGALPAVAAAEEPCTQLLANRTFEMTRTQTGAPLYWETAGNLTPRVVTETVHSGSQALLIGLPNAEEVPGDGWAWQWVTLPADVLSATLRFAHRVVSADGDAQYDRFEAGVLDTRRMKMAGGFVCAATQGWAPGTVDLTPYAGQTVAVAFHVRQDGNAGRTWAFVDDVSLCVQPLAVPVPAPAATNVEGLCWAEDGVADYALSGVPDFDQVREGGTPSAGSSTGTWTQDAATAAADVLWWLDSIHDPGELPPPTIADSYGLVTAYDAAYDDHAAANVPALISDLATRLGTSAAGTDPIAATTALSQYIASKGLQSQFTVTLHPHPTQDLLASAAAEGDGVILLLGFWEWQGTGFARLGGHYVALAGNSCDSVGPALALSDPWRDAAETGRDGRVSPWYRHMHSGSARQTRHDNAVVLSQDVYTVGEVGGVASLVGYSRGLGDLVNFLGLNSAPEQGQAAAYRGGLVFTRLDYAILISPAGSTTARAASHRLRRDGGSTASAAEAVLHGTLQRQGWPASSAPDFSSLVTLWRPYEFYPTYAWVLNTVGGAEWTTPPFAAGTYTARVKGEGTLANLRLTEELPAGTTVLDFGKLLSGDVVSDDRVDALDISALAAATSSGTFTSRFDLNADGVLNGADLALARVNFGNSGDLLVGMGVPPSALATQGEARAADVDTMAVLGLVPSASTAHLGHDWTLTVTAYAPNGPVDTVEVHLQFDPTLLRVVDAAGDPVSYVTAGNALPLVIQNHVDNETGRIDYVATTLASGGHQGRFAVAQIRFRPLAVCDATWVRFLSEGWPATMVAWRGAPALRRFDGAVVQISEEPPGRIYLPIVARP